MFEEISQQSSGQGKKGGEKEKHCRLSPSSFLIPDHPHPHTPPASTNILGRENSAGAGEWASMFRKWIKGAMGRIALPSSMSSLISLHQQRTALKSLPIYQTIQTSWGKQPGILGSLMKWKWGGLSSPLVLCILGRYHESGTQTWVWTFRVLALSFTYSVTLGKVLTFTDPQSSVRKIPPLCSGFIKYLAHVEHAVGA